MKDKICAFFREREMFFFPADLREYPSFFSEGHTPVSLSLIYHSDKTRHTLHTDTDNSHRLVSLVMKRGCVNTLGHGAETGVFCIEKVVALQTLIRLAADAAE